MIIKINKQKKINKKKKINKFIKYKMIIIIPLLKKIKISK